jgi:glycosyltransferase involved in cell wall biosynthesis
MNILILSTKLPYPARDGGSIATLNMALGLAKYADRVILLSLNTKKHFFPPDQIPGDVRSAIEIHTVPIDTSLRPLKALRNLLFSREPYIAERFYSVRFKDKLTELLSQNTVDVVQLEGPYTGHYIPAIRSASKARIALRAHNVEHEIWSRKAANTGNLLQRAYLRNMARRIRKLEARVLEASDHLVAISDRDRITLQGLCKRIDAITVPAGIDLRAYTPVKVVARTSVCFIGSLDWMPNQEGLLWMKEHVIPVIAATNRGFKFHVAGRNAPSEFIEKLKHPAIVIHGEVENAHQFLEDFHIMAVPLLTGSGIRIKIIEAMAMGLCVVTTPIGAEGLSAEHGKDLFLEADAKGFAGYLLKLLEQEHLCSQISGSAQQFVRENFDIFAVTMKLSKFYSDQL